MHVSPSSATISRTPFLPCPHRTHASKEGSTLITRFIDPAITGPINRPLLCSLAYPVSEIRSSAVVPSGIVQRVQRFPGRQLKHPLLLLF